MEYTFTFTLEQVNEIVSCMRQGPYGQVDAIVQEFSRQIRAQQPAAPLNGEDRKETTQ